jgi:hypothetical protein
MKDGVKQADAQNRFDEVFKYDGEVVFGGKKCHKIVRSQILLMATQQW